MRAVAAEEQQPGHGGQHDVDHRDQHRRQAVRGRLLDQPRDHRLPQDEQQRSRQDDPVQRDPQQVDRSSVSGRAADQPEDDQDETGEQQGVAHHQQADGAAQLGEGEPEVPARGADGGPADQEPRPSSSAVTAAGAVAAGGGERDAAEDQAGATGQLAEPAGRSLSSTRARTTNSAAIASTPTRTGNRTAAPSGGSTPSSIPVVAAPSRGREAPPCRVTLAGGDGEGPAHYDGPLGGVR